MTDFTVQTVRLQISESYPFKEKAEKSIEIQILLDQVKKNISDSLKEQLFELNNSTTRLNLQNILENHLAELPTDNFYVVCDDTNNTPETIDNNQLNVDVYIKPRGWQDTIPMTGIVSSIGIDFSELE